MAKRKANNKNRKAQDVTKIVVNRRLSDEVEIKSLKKQILDLEEKYTREINDLKDENLNLRMQIDATKPSFADCPRCKSEFILFCEGTKAGSFDYKVYSIAFPDALVFPIGVDTAVETMSENPMLCLKAFGIVDRDRRSEKEIEKLRNKGIYVLKVRSIENIFFTDGFLLLLLKQLEISKPQEKIQMLKAKAVQVIWKKEKRKVSKEEALIEYPNKEIIRFVEDELLPRKSGMVISAIRNILKHENKSTLRKVFLPYMPKIKDV